MKILVYGGTSYLGSVVSEYLVRNGYTVGNVSRKASKIPSVSNFDFFESSQTIIDKFKPEKIIYFSACFDNSDVESIIDVNIRKPLNILKALETQKEIEFISIGSFWQLGDSSNPGVAVDLYSASKTALSKFLDFYNSYTNLRCKEVIIPGTYGDNDSRKKLINILVDAALHRNCVELTDGRQSLNLVHTDDLCYSIEEVIHETECRKFQIRSSQCYSPRELVSLIRMYRELSVEFGKVANRKNEVKKIFVDDEYKQIVTCDKIPRFIESKLKNV